MTRRWPLLAAPLLLLAACSSDPVLLNEEMVDGATRVLQNTADAVAPGWTWCQEVGPTRIAGAPLVGTRFEFEDGTILGATILEQGSAGTSNAGMLEQLRAQGDQCELEAHPNLGKVFEPLEGLAEDELGWRSETPEGVWGEYVVVPLDQQRVLAYGFSTSDEDPPIGLDELGELAREGAEQFPATTG